MKLVIIGASRGVGKALLDCAVQEGHDIRVLARSPERVGGYPENVEIIKGDILDLETLKQAVAGADVVCSCIGVPITFSKVDVFSRGARNIIEAVGKNDGQRYITVSGIGAGESKGHGGFLYDAIFKPLFLKTIYEDKDREEELLKKSDIAWTIVRPAGMTNGKRTGNYRVIDDLTGVTAKRISRHDVADFMLKQAVEPTYVGKAVLLTY